MPTIKNILTKYPLKLFKISSTQKLDVEVVLSYAIKKPKEFLYTHPEYKLTKKQNIKFNALINRRLKNEPIAYITGEKEFYGLNFVVDKNVMIPSPETELLVDEAINEITKSREQENKKTRNQKIKYPSLSQGGVGGPVPPPAEGVRGRVAVRREAESFSQLSEKIKNQQIILIDIGTGSGCIPISIIKNLPKNISKNIKTCAIDISPKTLTIAQKNARLHGVEKKIEFIKSDLLRYFPFSQRGARGQTLLPRRGWGKVQPSLPTLPLTPSAGGGGSNIIITANLPYISNSEYKKLSPEVKNYEPKNALIAGNDGLKYYRQLFKQIQKLNSREITLKKLPSRGGVGGGGGLSITLLIEIDFKSMCSKAKLEKTIKQYLLNSKIEIKKDLSETERLAVIKFAIIQ